MSQLYVDDNTLEWDHWKNKVPVWTYPKDEPLDFTKYEYNSTNRTIHHATHHIPLTCCCTGWWYPH